ncbi:hypothetical protein RND71_032735 [Anisodus tanguticus]|uniref:DSBA-like thioredoxin domain-containing protein n=1 Tax=Anisodus tanguticus TaxID=243964 RepID=A0AAE1R6X9_9SOLA|nr:hypothetical protein RND71_032735 [Anisodus tanguticus]
MLSLSLQKFPISPRFLHRSMAINSGKKIIRIDISSDTVCPWCFVGKKSLDKATALTKDQYDFKIRWHPFLLNPSAPKEGVNKKDYYRNKFGPRSEQMISRMSEGLDKQNDLAEELFLGYFTQGRYIGDREFLIEAARKVGVEGAADFLENPNNGLKEVNEELQQYSSNISGVPHFVLNGKYQLSGGQPPESFIQAFQAASNITA